MKKIMSMFITIVLFLIMISCATTPEKEPEPAAALPESEYDQAKGLKKKVEKYGLGEYVPDEYRTAEKKYSDGEAAYNKDNASSKEYLDEAINNYRIVIEKGFPIVAGKKREEIETIKKQADDIKASVAVKDDYEKTQEVYDSALEEKRAGNYETALELLEKARGLFEEVYKKTEQKKERAEKSMEDSRKGIESAEERAEEAQKTMDQGQ